MAGGYTTPNDDALDQLRAELSDAKRRLDELERPTGSQLAQTVSQLASALANQVVPQVNSGSSNSYILTTSYQTVASFNFTTPTGYTKSLIFAAGAATILSNTASGEIGYVRILIGGSAGQEGRTLFLSSMDPSVSAFATILLTGLTAGQTILVEIQAKLTNGPGFNLPVAESGSVTGMALFQK